MTTAVHPSHNRPPPVYVEPATGIEARNVSCRYMDRGYSRIPVREGFVMVPKYGGSIIVILFPEYRGARL